MLFWGNPLPPRCFHLLVLSNLLGVSLHRTARVAAEVCNHVVFDARVCAADLAGNGRQLAAHRGLRVGTLQDGRSHVIGLHDSR